MPDNTCGGSARFGAGGTARATPALAHMQDKQAQYTNYFIVGQNLVEFVLDFGQQYDGEEPQIRTRLVTSPYFAKIFHAVLESSIREYEQRFGPIPDAEKEPAT